MSRVALNWRTVTDSRSPKFFVKQTELAYALYLNSRFAICEMRGAGRADGSFADFYRVRDAYTVSDAEVAKGVRAKVAFSCDTLEAALLWCDAQG